MGKLARVRPACRCKRARATLLVRDFADGRIGFTAFQELPDLVDFLLHFGDNLLQVIDLQLTIVEHLIHAIGQGLDFVGQLLLLVAPQI